MNQISFDSSQNILEFTYPDLAELDSITENLLSITKHWWVGRGNEVNPFEIGIVNREFTVSPYHPKLYEWINQCLKKAVANLYNGKSLEFAISEAWLTRSRSLTTASSHMHQCSYISGILYLTDTNSYTIFETISAELDYFSHTIGINDNLDVKTVKVKSEKGKLLLFPSRLKHKVKILNGVKDYRYTYIINTHPTGIISSDPTVYLEYNVKDIKDRYLEYVSKQESR